MGARGVRGLLPGEGRGPETAGELFERTGRDYPDEAAPRAGRPMMDAVSRGVVLAGGGAVYWEGPRPAWSRPEGRMPGELPGEPVRFDRMYRVGNVELYVDLVAGDRDTGWAEQKERGDLCRAAGAAYLYVDPDLPDDEIAEGVRSAVAAARPKK